MGRILFRYVCREIAAPFTVGLLIFTVVLFTTRILKLVELVVNRGVPFWELLKIFLYILPAFLKSQYRWPSYSPCSGALGVS